MTYPLSGSALSGTGYYVEADDLLLDDPVTRTWTDPDLADYSRSGTAVYPTDEATVLTAPGNRVWGGSTGILVVTIGPHWGIA